MIRLVIAGSRTVTPTHEMITKAVRESFAPDPRKDLPSRYIAEVICGDADGGDNAGAAWAIAMGIPVHHEPITAEDMRSGKYLGPRHRNRRMAIRGDAALIFWDGISGGSADMAIRMLARTKPCVVIPTAKRPPKKPRVTRGVEMRRSDTGT